MKHSDRIHRGFAKVIDFIIVGALAHLPGLVGVGAAAIYILICDGLFQGQSLGKYVMRVAVIVRDGELSGRPCGFRESIIRNLIFAVFILLGSVPLLQLIAIPIGLILIGVEAYFSYADEEGIRVGDIFAGTKVIDTPSSPQAPA